ncbi:CueP family metal-binding protein [Specibacter sp. NPDC078709]|uniref:CueP family metal-binding protein n=1 Tax=Specibacter sp. NPDC078709 TaxID=3154364 RepID=UPI003437E8CD
MTLKITRRLSLTGAIAAAAATVLLVAGCAAPAPAPTPAEVAPAAGQDLIDDLGFSGKNAKDIITELDMLPVAERSTELMASIRPGELVLKDAAHREATLPMPADEFYVSVAPYVSQTHTCHFHSLTTCLGELQNKDVDVTVKDRTTGAVVMQESVKTYDNGFVGLWLPRGMEATLTVGYEDQTASQTISTIGGQDPTCLTTLQLS